jgi:hypothetical protein
MVEMGLQLRPRHRLAMLAAREDVLLLHRDRLDSLQALTNDTLALVAKHLPQFDLANIRAGYDGARTT